MTPKRAMDSPEGKIKAGFLWLGSSVALVRVMDALALVVVLMHITEREMGTVALAMATARVAEALVGEGFSVTAAIVQAERLSEAQQHSAMWYAAGVGALGVLGLSSLAPAMAWAFDNETLRTYLLLLAPRALFLPLWTVNVAFLDRALRFADIAHIRTGSSFVAAASRVALAPSLGGAWALVLSHLVQGLFVMLAAFWISGYRMRRVFEWAAIRPLARFGAPLTFAHVARAMLHNVDYFLIGKLLGERALGLYRVAFELAVEISIPLLQIIHNATRPVLARIKNDPGAYFRTFFWFSRTVLLAFAPLSAFIYWGAPDLLSLMASGEMRGAVEALDVTRVLVFVCLGRVAFELIPVAFITSDRPAEVLRYELLALALLTLGLGITLSTFGNAHGPVVAAWTWLGLYPALLLAIVARACRVLGMPLGPLASGFAHSAAGLALHLVVGWGLSLTLPASWPAGARLLCLAPPLLLTSGVMYLAARGPVPSPTP